MSEIRRTDPAPVARQHPTARIAMVAALLAAVSGGNALAQSTADLTRISVEDLMRLEVTSVSKKERPLGTSRRPSSSSRRKTSAAPAVLRDRRLHAIRVQRE